MTHPCIGPVTIADNYSNESYCNCGVRLSGLKPWEDYEEHLLSVFVPEATYEISSLKDENKALMDELDDANAKIAELEEDLDHVR